MFKRWMLTLFITIYGSLILVSELNDGHRHRQSVYDHYMNLPLDQFMVELGNIITFNSNDNQQVQEDVFIHVLSYFVGGILEAPGLFFVFVAFIYGYFFSGSILKVLRHIPPFKHAKLLYGFIVVFLLWKNVEGINIVRTWTGMWILFYAAISFLETRKAKYLLLMFAPPLVHIGYFIMIWPVIIVILLGARPMLYAALFTLSFTTAIFNQGDVVQQFEQTEVGKEKVKDYLVAQPISTTVSAQEKLGSATWYARLQRFGVTGWGINLLTFSIILLGFYSFRRMEKMEMYLFSMGLLMKVLSNSTWFIFALSNRSSLISGLFILAAFVLMFSRFELSRWREKFFGRILVPISFVLLIPFIVYRIADLIQYTSVFIFLFPFIGWINSDINVSIRAAIGQIL